MSTTIWACSCMCSSGVAGTAAAAVPSVGRGGTQPQVRSGPETHWRQDRQIPTVLLT